MNHGCLHLPANKSDVLDLYTNLKIVHSGFLAVAAMGVLTALIYN